MKCTVLTCTQCQLFPKKLFWIKRKVWVHVNFGNLESPACLCGSKVLSSPSRWGQEDLCRKVTGTVCPEAGQIHPDAGKAPAWWQAETNLASSAQTNMSGLEGIIKHADTHTDTHTQIFSPDDYIHSNLWAPGARKRQHLIFFTSSKTHTYVTHVLLKCRALRYCSWMTPTRRHMFIYMYIKIKKFPSHPCGWYVCRVLYISIYI